MQSINQSITVSLVELFQGYTVGIVYGREMTDQTASDHVALKVL